MKTAEEMPKPTLSRCVCGRQAIDVRHKGKKMISCPNPEKCIGNLRTQWHGRMDDAIREWEKLVNSFEYTKNRK